MTSTPAHEIPDISVTESGSMLRITLGRPRQLGALTAAMCRQIRDTLAPLQPGDYSAVLFDSVSDRAFCGGGDVKAMLHSPDAASNFLTVEYEMDLTVANCAVPTVAFMRGITMGGGLGIAAHCDMRIVTPESRLAMPETRIGIIPDVGIMRTLAKTTPLFGEIVTACSTVFGAGDALVNGFADAVVPAAALPKIGAALAAGVDPEAAVGVYCVDGFAAPLTDLCGRLASVCAPAAGGELWLHAERLRDGLRRLAAADEAAVAETTGAGDGAGVQDAGVSAAALLTELSGVCPVAVVAGLCRLAELRRRPGVTLAEVLREDLAIIPRLVARPDFREGVRAQLIDKDRQPKFQPREFAAVPDRRVLEILSGR